jgi:ribosome biogenesis GTPase A
MKQIQWFPGHMAKARRLIEEKLKIIDIVFEVVDARIPISSSNPMLNEIIGLKPKLVLLNKTDLADPNITNNWLTYYQERGIEAIAVNSLTDNLTNLITKKAQDMLSEVLAKESEKGMSARPIRAMVLGIPNSGKSQLINNLAKKTKVQTGNRPGITKIQSFLNISENLKIYDNPGVLWPKFDDDTGLKLALLGSIKDSIIPLDDVTLFGIEYLMKYYPKNIEKRYDMKIEQSESRLDILDKIGKKRGCLISGGEIDYDRVYSLFLYDLRNGQLGRMSFERAEDYV